jgi:hypothetical protein
MTKWTLGQVGQNKAKSKKAKMNVMSYVTMDYENKPPIRAPKKQSQTSKRQKPMQTLLPQRIMKKTAFSSPGKTNPIKANFNQFQSQKILPRMKINADFCDNGLNLFRFSGHNWLCKIWLNNRQIIPSCFLRKIAYNVHPWNFLILQRGPFIVPVFNYS